VYIFNKINRIRDTFIKKKKKETEHVISVLRDDLVVFNPNLITHRFYN
jgi:hypothetical protein